MTARTASLARRVGVLTRRNPVTPAREANDAFGVVYRRLRDLLPDDEALERVAREHHIELRLRPGAVSHSEKLLQLSARITASDLSAADREVLQALPVRELDALGLDAEGFVQVLARIEAAT